MGNGGSKPRDGQVSLGNFDMLKVIGKGAFGKVRIVQKKDSKALFALKYIDKMQCIRMRAIQNVFRERAILQELDHPFIVNLQYAFQDDQNLFFVLDLKTGGDLRHHLNGTLGFSEEAVKVWGVELSSAVHYLHRHHIVHRDIKPDNVLLDERGHVHLTDFNIAVTIDRGGILKSRSGTMAYLAPEVFGEDGYYWQVDYWSLGVMLYELIYFKRPFRGKTTAAMITSIKESSVSFPKTNVFSRSTPVDITQECVAFLTELMDRNPSTRLGCRSNQINDIMNHAWMNGIDWKAAERKELESLFIPTTTEDNFDPRINLEEFLLDGFPIEPTPRQKKKKTRQSAKRTTSSSPNPGSLMAYLSGNTSDRKKSSTERNAADAAAVAGNIQEMIHQYNDGKDKSGIAKRFGLGKKQSAEKMTEAERVEMELRFMVDHFLPFDKSKDFGAVKGLGYGVAPPLPPIPSSVTAVPLDSAIAAQSVMEEGIKYGEETPMESFLKSNPLLDFRDDENLVSRISFTPSSENDGSMEDEGRTSQLLTSLYSTRDFGKNVGLSVVVDTNHVANVTESSSYGLAVNAGSSLEAGTFSGGAMSPLAVQARYDDRESRKYGASPAAEVLGNRF